MMFRLLFTLACTVLILALMPYLNRGRLTEEKAIISYRMQTFETRLKPPVVEPIEKQKKEIKPEEIPDVSLDTPQLETVATSPTVDMMRMTSPTFSASGMVFQVGKMAEKPIETSVVSIPKPTRMVIQSDGSDHLIYGPKPITPLRARQQGLSGKVIVQFEVTEQGLVENIKVIEKSNEIFERPVVNAVAKYKFRPYTDENSVAVRVLLAKEFDFEVR